MPRRSPPLAGAELAALAKQVPEWRVVNNHHINRSFAFPDFKAALAFVNRVGKIAEDEGHHPDIFLTWGKAEITSWTTRSLFSTQVSPRVISSWPQKSTPSAVIPGSDRSHGAPKAKLNHTTKALPLRAPAGPSRHLRSGEIFENY